MSLIYFPCSRCGRPLHELDEHIGITVYCPKCGETQVVPMASRSLIDAVTNRTRSSLNALVLVSLGIYAVSFILPAGSSIGLGFFIPGLVFCWFPLAVPWWANVLYAVGVMQMTMTGNPTKVAHYGCLASALAGIWLPFYPELAAAPAYLAWLGSMLLLGIGAWVIHIRSATRDRPPTQPTDSNSHPDEN